MTIEELEAFIAAAESETYVAPNGDLHRYSSSAAAEILSLEAELGCKLFDRNDMDSGIITEAGETLLPYAKKFVREYHQIKRMMENYRDSPKSSLYIGSLPLLRQYRLTSFFTMFREDHMYCDMHMEEEADARTLVEDLDKGYYDAIVLLRDQLYGRQYRTIPLASDEVAAVLPENHPYASRPKISLRELKNESFFLSNPHSTSYSYCKQLLIKNHISTENVHTSEINQILQVVRDGQGTALLPISSLNVAKAKGITAVPLEPRAALSVVLAFRRDRNQNEYLASLIAKARERAKAIPAL